MMNTTETEEYPITRLYTNGVLAGTFILTGIVANIVVIVSWLLDRARWLPLYYYFLAFASWNLTLLISTFFFYSLPALLRQPADQSTIQSVPYFYVVGYTGANCALTAVVWLMVVVTVERYVAVTKPFHTRISSPRRRAKLISGTLSLLAVLYNVPLTFELSIIGPVGGDMEMGTNSSLIYFWMVEPAPFRANFYYQTFYRVMGHLIFISLLPFITISALTVKIVLIIRRTNSERAMYARAAPVPDSCSQSTSLRTNRNYRTSASSSVAASYGNVLLTVFVVKFLICYTLPFALNVLELLTPAYVFQTAELKWITDASDFLVIVDSVSNAFLYFSWRRRARFYKRKRTLPSTSMDPAPTTEKFSAGGISPKISFRTLSRRERPRVHSNSGRDRENKKRCDEWTLRRHSTCCRSHREKTGYLLAAL